MVARAAGKTRAQSTGRGNSSSSTSSESVGSDAVSSVPSARREPVTSRIVGAPAHDDLGATHAHLRLVARLDRERDRLGYERDPQPRVPQRDAERDAGPVVGEPRVEREDAAVVTEAAEARDQGAPHAARGGDVHAVGRVVVQVGEVDEERGTEVPDRQLVVADLGRDDRLHDRRERRVARGQRVVVLEVRALRLGGEPVALQVEREHDVGLLEHLEAVDDERVVVQQQGSAVLGGVLEVPQLLLQERGVLGVDAELLVERDVHVRGRTTPAGHLTRGDPEALHEPVVGDRVEHLQVVDRAGGRGEVRPGHDVRVEVVVHDRRVLVGPGHAVDVEYVVGVRSPEAEVLPHPRGLDEDVDRTSREEVLVAGGRDVLAQRIRDVGVDVVLRGAGGVVRRRLLSVDRAPGEQGAVLVELHGPGAGGVEHPLPEAQRVAGDDRRRVGEEREHVDLAVPEVVAAVAGARDTLRRHPAAIGTGGGLGELEEVPPGGLLDRRLRLDLDVGAVPEVVEPGA
ncbi:MAG: hypothetical protein K0S05_1910, partial [Agromyces sp.]|nr:hypothetical protein [Agromyces sp.]